MRGDAVTAPPSADAVRRRLCGAALGLLSTAATYVATPDTWKEAYERAAAPGDTVVLLDGLYETCLVLGRAGRDGAPITYRAARAGGAVARCVRIAPDARFVRLEGLSVLDAPGHGVTIEGDDIVLDGVTVARAKTHGILFACRSRDEPCSDPPRRNLVSAVDVGWSGNTGIKFDAGEDNRIVASRFHHSHNNGFLENGDNVGVEVVNSEFDHNGVSWVAHGLYMKGRSGRLRRNRVHHNAGYGIHCWASCYGTPLAPYVIEENEVYENGRVRGSEIVVGGSGNEAGPPNDGRPHHVVVRRNLVHDGSACGLHVMCNCAEPGQGEGVLFADNRAWNNRRGALCVQGCADLEVAFRRNTFWSDDPGAPLVWLHSARLDEGALDTNAYWRSASGAGSPGTIVWNGRKQSLEGARAGGALQNRTGCAMPYDVPAVIEPSGRWLEGRPLPVPVEGAEGAASGPP